MPDFTVQDERTIFLLTPERDAGQEWASEHLPADALTFGPAIVGGATASSTRLSTASARMA